MTDCRPCPSPATPKPDDLVVVPPGSMVVQAPCGEGCAPASSAAIEEVPGGADQPGNCDQFRNPCISQTFNVVAIGKSGTFYVNCASAWALPGLHVFFPGLGYLEVLGVSGDVITYRNLTIELGTEISAGLCFAVTVPAVPLEEDEDGNPTYEDSATLDAVYGVEGNIAKRILPGNGTLLAACGGKWQKRQAGLMFYPETYARIYYSGRVNFANRTSSVALPGYPAGWECSLGKYALLTAEVQAWKFDDDDFPNVGMALNGVHCCHASAGFKRGKVNTNTLLVPVSSNSLTVSLIKRNNDRGDMEGSVWIHGYFY